MGGWVEFIKGKDGASKGQMAVLGNVEHDARDWSKGLEQDGAYTELYCFVYVDKDGLNQESYLTAEEIAKCVQVAKAPQYVVAWSTEDQDPFTYALTREEADKLVKRRRVGGEKVVEARVFKAVK